uniref:Putative secreted peptide n=1 Tax=Anopheles braziliensis TaxID=58242 RepID=A0A2M3ZVC0_9DIPT
MPAWRTRRNQAAEMSLLASAVAVERTLTGRMGGKLTKISYHTANTFYIISCACHHKFSRSLSSAPPKAGHRCCG